MNNNCFPSILIFFSVNASFQGPRGGLERQTSKKSYLGVRGYVPLGNFYFNSQMPRNAIKINQRNP